MKNHFFEVRRKLNRETFLLYALFFIATLILLGLVHLLISKVNLIHSLSNLTLTLNKELQVNSELNIGITSLLFGFIMVCFIYKYITTRSGYLIARQLGGTEVTNNHSNPYYRILNQTILEMSIAANLSPPRAFILLGDDTINAFAAGTTEKDAVIGITQGALESLTPSELKALIAHEVSHIVNGDTRMNRKTTAVIFGFMALTSFAYMLFRIGGDLSRGTRSSSRNNNAFIIMMAFFIVGLAVWLLSKLLEMFGKIIQSALSRKREYYADSQAVVNMRAALPIYNLLKKLQHSASIPEQKNRHAAKFGDKLNKKFGKGAAPEYQHFYFNHTALFSMFATHPSLEKRMEAIKSMMNTHDKAGLYKNSSEEKTLYEEYGPLNNVTNSNANFSSSEHTIGFNSPLTDFKISAPTLQTQAEISARIPKNFIKDLNDPSRFPLLIYAALLSNENMIRNHQLKNLSNIHEADLLPIIHTMNNNEIEYKSVLYRLLYSKFHALPMKDKENILMQVRAMTDRGSNALSSFAIRYTLERLTHPSNKPQIFSEDDQMNALIFLITFILQKTSHPESLMQIQQDFEIIMSQIDPENEHTMSIIAHNWQSEFEHAITVLNQQSLNDRKMILQRLKEVVIRDAIITQEEYEILQLLGFCLNVPIAVNLDIQ